ncbi:MAG: neutral/alkaline non-lysosomal ceramidase N-terminal domain-containing protein [Verrucomicrobia bacterium]|nr:neutral/alkaline non-lysosomal ceramidase N-terminal domain-containing protein [Verrucomicrobiota bacterium]
MNTFKSFLGATLALSCVATNVAHSAELAAGAAAVDITPPVPYRMEGYFSERLSTGIHDPLWAKALVLRQGEEQMALVFCDLCMVPNDVTTAARRLAEQQTGIPAHRILIAATHSHTGPLYASSLREYFHQQAVAKNGNDPHEIVDYPAELSRRLAQAVADAAKTSQAARIKAGVAQQRGLSFNRRFHMKDGSVRFNPGQLNPDIVRPAGPIDPDVGILLVDRAKDRQPMASLTVFALHLDTTGGTLYSADYPYYLEQTLRQSLGQGLVSLFGTGTCGDINHIDVTTRERLKTQHIGETLAATVRAKIPELEPIAQPRLAVRSQTVSLPLRQYTPAEIAAAREAMHKIGTKELSFLDQVKAYEIMNFVLRGPGPLPALVQVFRLSDEVALVGLPGEVFVDLGLAIKKASPFKTTMVVELSQDCPDYVPTRRAFTEGSYETVCSWIEPGGGEKLVEAAVAMLKELKP